MPHIPSKFWALTSSRSGFSIALRISVHPNTKGFFHYPWTDAGLSDNLLDREMLRRICHRKLCAWKHPNRTETEQLWKAQESLCHTFIRRFKRMPRQRLFLLGSKQGNLLGLGLDPLQAGDFVWVTPGSARPLVFRSRQKHRKTAKDEGSHRVVLLTRSWESPTFTVSCTVSSSTKVLCGGRILCSGE
jgi:hypothetical protein